MPRRGENIYKRKDGRWEGRVLKPDGTYRSVYAVSYREVRDKKKDYWERLQLRDAGEQDTGADAAGLLENWLLGEIRSRVKPSTYGSYDGCMRNYILPFFREAGNERLTEESTARFVKRIDDSTALSEAYRRKILTIFKTALKELEKSSAVSPRLLDIVRLPKANNTEVQVFSIREQRLIENAALSAGDVRAFGIILTFYTGIRLGELCALKWSDFDEEAGTMSVTKTVTRVKNFTPGGSKTTLNIGTPKSQKSMRTIPLPGFIQKMYCEYKQVRSGGSGYLFSGTEMPTDPRAYEKLFKKILAAAGVKDRKFHAIRHTFATRALEIGVDIKTLSDILGHASVSITLNIYAHSLLEQKKIAMDKFNTLHVTYMEAYPFAVKIPVAET